MFKVYWTNPESDTSNSSNYEQLTTAIKACEIARNSGRTFVTMVSEDANSIGKPGVTSVENGKLPDGTNYEWKKRRP